MAGPLSVNGYPIIRNPVSFMVYRNAALTLTATTVTALPFDTKEYDTGNNVDITTNKGRFTATIPGLYFFNGRCSTTTTRVFNGFLKNGSEYKRATDNNPSSSSIGAMAAAPILCVAGDFIEYYYWSAGATALDVGAALSWFAGYLVSPS